LNPDRQHQETSRKSALVQPSTPVSPTIGTRTDSEFPHQTGGNLGDFVLLTFRTIWPVSPKIRHSTRPRLAPWLPLSTTAAQVDPTARPAREVLLRPAEVLELVLQQTRSHAERVSHRAIIGGMPWIRGALLKLGFHVSQATVSRYMPRRGYPLTQTWRTFLRNQAFAIGTTGLGEAGRLSDALLALVRAGSRELSGASPRCGMASLAGLSSHRTDCRHIALPTLLIGAPFMVVACRSLLGPPL
jgi:hypothetical protein